MPFFAVSSGNIRCVEAADHLQAARTANGRGFRVGESQGDRMIHVYVRLAEWKHEWRTVQAESLSESIDVASKMPDVVAVLEASWLPGGVVT